MKKISFIIVILFASKLLIAQGCSDAGFCSLSVLKNEQSSHSYKNSFSIGANYGSGDQNTSTINPYIEFTRKLNKKWSVQAKITATYANGFLGSNFNAGDVFAFVTHSTTSKNTRHRFTWLGGIKLPLTTSNDKNKNSQPLPLDYQSSLGTFDAIVGFNYVANKKWELNTGLQIPVINSNKNSFFPSEFTDPQAMKFPPTNLFERKSDALVRVGYYIQLPKSITIKPNLLAIYHLGNDAYTNQFGKVQTLDNSQGLTLNGGVVVTKYFNTKNELELVAATPFVARTIRPDGLTRSAVINLQYKFNF